MQQGIMIAVPLVPEVTRYKYISSTSISRYLKHFFKKLIFETYQMW